MRKSFAFIALFFLLLLFPVFVRAQEFRDDYDVVYRINEDGKNISTLVKFAIKLTNLRSDLFVKKFTLAFPKSFVIKNLQASDDKGGIKPSVTSNSSSTRIELEFTDPQVGKGNSNTFYLTFNQENLFKVNGNVWEVILPTIEGRHEGDYQVQIYLPQDSTKKISIAKPQPSQIQGNVIFWKNPPSKTIYAVFGDVQLYDLDLTYNLDNPKLFRVYTDVAFPPDMLHQKVYVDSISPKPALVYLDEDGNYMGRYYLNPRENKKVTFKGIAALYVSPRDEVKVFNEKQLTSQKKYLLSQTSYWKVDEISKYKDLKTPADIFNYINTNFSYDYSRLSKNGKRLGASAALKSPDKAVCVEFADSFVALAREKGIYSREIEGYGFSSDPQLRPLSLLTDILHSWPEYYDSQAKEWVSIDPTWQNTSGIDYLNSFDLDHIAFAIHSKRPDYPLPAGMYKLSDTRDISIEATSTEPKEEKRFSVSEANIDKTIDSQQENEGEVSIKNEGNTFQYNIPVKLKNVGLSLSSSTFTITALAPQESKNLDFTYKSSLPGKTGEGEFAVEVAGKIIYRDPITIQPYYYHWAIILSLFILAFCTIFIVVRFLRKRKKKLYAQKNKASF